MFVDCVHIKIHRCKSVSTDVFYVALPMTKDGTREVFGFFNMSAENTTVRKASFIATSKEIPP